MSAATLQRTRRLAICGGSLLGIFATAAPASAVDEDFRIWENVTAIAKLGSIDPSLKAWRLWLESQGRFRSDGATADQALGRAGVGYALTDNASLWLGTRFGFDQNRGFAGLGYSFSEKARVEIGYMNQLIQSRVVSRREQKFDRRVNHIFSVSMFLNL